ncbi:uncharacterized protein (TIGR02453 family) [Dysgonomonas sp. PFB1-18]|uniref:DUF2461 domain-containing protein n=1 Tax=unclassified Dysgonomonas TaxID=2630389 RepID=UPI0024767AB3|nr:MULTISPECIES: DUF2461 domain-containing protein [unclassified Dysgonomonas]MDH6309772.1 uncharacterized protein (TIGR02453 family) [Dysgonomonas sp. PF1-14]MDH6339220.1 uncharacterized protein (TIGR02453 family) [Dysgonomonas sp. PF1-16]MDH6380719.1 uncharacterized protein (TIGR02453 family) [Dysgonomonas sp. PFB1-18]MDH6398215.1 uncharacterized protein (TIGR02453 family) [Dysgonomonas sp. PF1-23]
MAKEDSLFKGFTPQTFQFFKDLKENNYKEWFDANKHIYEKELLNPLKALVTALSPAMYNIDPAFELRPHRCLSRIYRDIRFSKNKDPYKDFMWMAFQIPVTNDVWKDYPGYFMEINADGYALGLGLFQPKKKVMDAFRDEVAYDAEEFQRVTQKTVLDRGYVINGEEYKRPVPNDLPEYFQPWIQRKGIWVSKTRPVGEELYSAAFAEMVKEDFVAMEWLYNFMKEATQL